jgi:O-antigen/teichoic acid export membrane protein
VVARSLGPGPLGVYSMAFRLAYMPYLLVAVVICGAAFAHLCRLRGDEVGRAVTDAGAAVATAVVPLYLGMLLLAPQLELLGSTWAPGVAALRWLAAYGAVLSVVRLCLVTLNAVSRTRDSFLLNLLHLLLLTGLLLLLAGGGVELVAVAQLLAGAVTLLLAVRSVRRRVTGFAWRTLTARLAPVLGGAALMTVTVLLAQQLLPWTRVSAPGLVLVGALALAAYSAPVVLLNSGLRPVLTAGGRR